MKASPRPRRVPTALLALLGAGAALAYGYLVARMTWSAPLVMLGLGGMTLMFFAVALYRIVDPLLRPDAGRTDAPRAPARMRELEREKQAVLKAIREVEQDFHMRKIAEADYQEMTQRYRARAMRLIRELDAGDDYRSLIEHELKNRLAAQAVASTATCGACAAVNDADAKFCKKCGKPMGGADA